TVPSVTAFALGALTSAGIDARYPDAAVSFLVRSQTPDGDFGMNSYYCATHYYLLRPIVSTLVTVGAYPAAARARDFVLGGRQADGSFFSTTEGYEGFSSPEYHTALAVETLAHSGLTAAHPAVSAAVDWLVGRQRPDGSFHGGLYATPSTGRYREIERTQHVYTTASALSALGRLAAEERTARVR
ncbi:MAG TPA: prenyltransferase/squalene oxidase repeat-containing protein, partial [Umezawaea sp.]|nr:prenyltransferase/squalene oxidase repeat-containing protein [Umezawaea sp.]